MTARIIPFPRRPAPLSRRELHVLARTVLCPDCEAPIGKPCTITGTPIVQITGPHRRRIAVAEAAAERNETE